VIVGIRGSGVEPNGWGRAVGASGALSLWVGIDLWRCGILSGEVRSSPASGMARSASLKLLVVRSSFGVTH
jgi:hypothetical protein